LSAPITGKWNIDLPYRVRLLARLVLCHVFILCETPRLFWLKAGLLRPNQFFKGKT
jgi:hypothetical protein